MSRRLAARAASALLAATFAACAAEPADPGRRTVRTAAQAGTPVRVAAFARWNEQCQAAGLPAAEITTPPPHGTLEPRQAIVVAGGRLFAGTTNCRDKLIPGLELWYTPAPRYRGTDRMDYQVDSGQGPVRFTATVDVR